MGRHRTVVLWAVLTALTLSGCSKPEPSGDISEDQLNHFTGVETHDHPDNLSNQAGAESSEPTNAGAPRR